MQCFFGALVGSILGIIIVALFEVGMKCKNKKCTRDFCDGECSDDCKCCSNGTCCDCCNCKTK
jgi:hypothetical protein